MPLAPPPAEGTPVLARPREQPISLEVLRINLLQLQAVDHLTQTFSARYFVHLRIRDGASDPDLLHDIDEQDPKFPRDTLRPGAKWFLKQIDLPTALDFRFIDAKVVLVANDIDLVFKVAGQFFSTMRLASFPVDAQRLSLLLAVNTASEGIVPVKFLLTKDAAITVAKGTFALSNLWDLHDCAMVDREVVEPMPGTSYPALRISALVTRKPIYFYVNVIVPLCSLTFLGLLQFLLPAERFGTNVTFRITYSVTILLTTATYKLFIASALPVGLAYLTLLDEYVLFCYLLQVFVVSETAVVGALVMRSEYGESDALWLPKWSTSVGDFVCACACVSIFLLGHAWFFVRLMHARTTLVTRELDAFESTHYNRRQREDSNLHFTRYRRRASHGSFDDSTKGRERFLTRELTQNLTQNLSSFIAQKAKSNGGPPPASSSSSCTNGSDAAKTGVYTDGNKPVVV